METAIQSKPTAPGIGQAVGLLAIFIGLQTVVTLPFFAVSFLRHRKLDLPVAGLLAAIAASLVATVWLGTLICKMPWRQLVAVGPLPGRLLPALLVLCTGSLVLSSEVENLTRFLLPLSAKLAVMMEQMLDVRGSPVVAGLLLVVAAPVSEELICRGWLLRGLLQRCAPWKSIAISAFVFGAMHMNPWQFFYASLVGAVLGFVYWRTRSLLLCIIAHGFNNSASFLVSLLQTEVPGMSGNFARPVEFQPWWLDALGAVLLLAGGGWLSRLTRREVADVRAQPSLLPVVATGQPPVIDPR